LKKVIDLRQKIEPVAEVEPKPQSAPPSESTGKPEIISWTGFLYHHDPDMKAVWITVAIFWTLAAVLQIFQKNIIATVLMALIGLMILFQAKRKHDNTGKISFSPKGIEVGNFNYVFPDIKSFWVDYEPEHGIEELSLHLKKWYMPYIRVPIDGQDPVRLRGFLIQYIPETRHETSLSETLARRLGL